MKKYLIGFMALMLSVVTLQAADEEKGKDDEARILPVEEPNFVSSGDAQDETLPPEQTFAPEEDS